MMRLPAGQRRRIGCTINGVTRSGFVEARTLLSDFLRHELNLYGTHVGCEHGICGACTIILDGRLARACVTLAAPKDGVWAPGHYYVLFEDPDGIRLEVNFVPGKGLLEDGARLDPGADYPVKQV